MRSGIVTRMAVVLATACLSLDAGAQTQNVPESFILNLMLESALPAGSEFKPDGPEIVIELECQQGNWPSSVAYARRYNAATHFGYVTAAAVSGDTIDVTLVVDLVADMWLRHSGGKAEYRIKLKRTGELTVAGSYVGQFKGHTYTNVAHGTLYSPQPVAGHRLPAPGEHPRILFRGDELAALRKKAETPFGKVALARMDASASGLGLKYQLTGDASFAAAARKEASRLMGGGSYPWYGTAAFTPDRPAGGALIHLALAYDLCFDAWPEPFRTEVKEWMLSRCERHMIEFLRHVSSNHGGHTYAGIGFVGMALWGQEGPAPSPPPDWLLGVDLPAASGYTPPEGVPVAPLEPGKSPDRWLVCEPADGMWSEDPVRRTFGFEKQRPANGGTCEIDGHKLTFRPAKFSTPDPKGGLYIYDLYKGQKAALRVAAYTVIDCREPGLYLFRQAFTGLGRVQVMLSGHPIADGQVVRLEKGLYPCNLLSHTLVRWKWLRPTLTKATDQDLETWLQTGLPELKRQIAQEQKVYLADKGIWDLTGGQDQRVLRTFRYGRYCNYLHARETVGTGGFQGEISHYGIDAGDGPNLYYTCFPKMFGYSLTPFDDYSAYLPRKVCATIYPKGGETIYEDINGKVGGLQYFSALFPVVKDAYKPAILWAWNTEAGVTDEASREKVLIRDGVEAFLHYPLDMKPCHPADGLPKTWYASDMGLGAFRNGWKGKEDILFKAFAKAHKIGGWNAPNAGTFRLFGLGRSWTSGEAGRQRPRGTEPVVQLPDEKGLNLGAMGRVTHMEQQEDGSGVMTIDLSDVYATGGGERSFYGNLRLDSTFKDSGISGLRSIGVDYSGRSGSPCLLAIVDVVKGGGRKVWAWRTPGDPSEALSVDGNRLVYKRDDAALTGMFASPGAVKIEARVEKIEEPQVMLESRMATFHAPGIYTEGADPKDGAFFFVATLQRGTAPAMTVEGEGLDAVVRVGKRTVRFDGKNVVFE